MNHTASKYFKWILIFVSFALGVNANPCLPSGEAPSPCHEWVSAPVCDWVKQPLDSSTGTLINEIDPQFEFEVSPAPGETVCEGTEVTFTVKVTDGSGIFVNEAQTCFEEVTLAATVDQSVKTLIVQEHSMDHLVLQDNELFFQFATTFEVSWNDPVHGSRSKSFLAYTIYRRCSSDLIDVSCLTSLDNDELLLDHDGDGFSSWMELAIARFYGKSWFFANPCVAEIDTDGDGMPDAYEEMHDCLNPQVDDANDDADSDGVSNYSEMSGWIIGDLISDECGLWAGPREIPCRTDNNDPCVASDYDEDGISDFIESQYDSLDPFVADSDLDPDGDNVSSLIEIEMGQDPGSYTFYDTDGDGLGDILEASLGTDPNNADSDFDGMPDGWEHGWSSIGLNPLDGSDAVEDYDQDLMTNLEEYQYETNPSDINSEDNGAGDHMIDTLELWSGGDPWQQDQDGLTVAYRFGLSNYEAHAAMFGDYIDGDGDGLTDDIENLVNSDPLTRFSDTDALPDGLELNHFLDPLSEISVETDSDGDGLYDLDEFALGISPLDQDTDGDGIDDSLEVLWLDPDSGEARFDARSLMEGLLDWWRFDEAKKGEIVVDSSPQFLDGIYHVNPTESSLLGGASFSDGYIKGSAALISSYSTPRGLLDASEYIARLDLLKGSLQLTQAGGYFLVPEYGAEVLVDTRTFAFWINLRSKSGPLQDRYIFGRNREYEFTRSSDGTFNFNIWTDSGVIEWNSGYVDLLSGTWAHCILTVDAQTGDISLNVASTLLDFSVAENIGGFDSRDSEWPFQIGAIRSIPDRATFALIDDFRVYDRVLTDLEVAMLQDIEHPEHERNADYDDDGLANLLEFAAGANPFVYDSDGDGLSDSDEVLGLTRDINGQIVLLKSDPTKQDTDGDGINDGDEVLIYGTDPQEDTDTDGDGLGDTEEVQIHLTDPFLADSDGDGLSDGSEVFVTNTNPLSPSNDEQSDFEQVYLVPKHPIDVGVDDDGMPDAWEILHFGDLDEVAFDDFDADGIPNIFEYYHLTSPVDPLNLPLFQEVQYGSYKHYIVDASLEDETDYRKSTIQAAINAAGDYDLIEVHPGVYDYFSIDKKLAVFARGSAKETIVGAEQAWYTPSFTDYIDMKGIRITEECFLSGLTVGTSASGYSTNTVGLYVNVGEESHPPRIEKFRILGNDVYGAIYCGQGSPQFRSCTIAGNSGLGAGLYVQSGSPTFIGCSFTANRPSSTNSSAVYIHESNLGVVTFESSILWNEACEQEIDSNGTTLVLTNTIVRDATTGSAFLDGVDLLTSDLEFGYDFSVTSNSVIRTVGLAGAGFRDRDNELCLDGLLDPGSDEYVDTDGDGLPDWLESDGVTEVLGDSDGDHIDNITEYTVYQTDPRVSDTDKDGLTDDQELTLGTNPLSPDTDSDGRSDYDEYTYGFDPLTAFAPSELDRDRDGMIDSVEVQYFSLIWASGINSDGSKRYLTYTRDTGRESSDDDTLPNFVELEIGTNPLLADTDGDGLNDDFEFRFREFVDPLVADQVSGDEDHDGLSNLEEELLGTHPFNADTDGDGLGDGWELKWSESISSDPLVAGVSGADWDNDGLIDLYEYQFDTNPSLADGEVALAPIEQRPLFVEGTVVYSDAAGDPVFEEENAALDSLTGLPIIISYIPQTVPGTDSLYADEDGNPYLNPETKLPWFNEEYSLPYVELDLDGLPTRRLLTKDGTYKSLADRFEFGFLSPEAEHAWFSDEYGLYYAELGEDALPSGQMLTVDGEYVLYDVADRIDFFGIPGTGTIIWDEDFTTNVSPGDGISDLWEVLNGSDPMAYDAFDFGLYQRFDRNHLEASQDTLIDSDGDGLSNDVEMSLGTDPYLVDSDTDGYPDGWEQVNGLDPLVSNDADSDSDGDGVLDSVEFTESWSPIDFDTDGDGLADGWELLQLDPDTDEVLLEPRSLLDGLVNWWRFDQVENGNIIFDSMASFPDGIHDANPSSNTPLTSRNYNDGILRKNAQIADYAPDNYLQTDLADVADLSAYNTPRRLGKSLQLTGEDSYFVVPHDESLSLIGTTSFAFWINWAPDLMENQKQIFNKNGEYRLLLNADQTMTLEVETVNGLSSWTSAVSSVITPNTWIHVVLMIEPDTGDLSLKVNTRSNSSESVDSGNVGTFAASALDWPLILGSPRSAPNLSPEAYIDDFRIYNRALTELEVQILANPAHPNRDENLDVDEDNVPMFFEYVYDLNPTLADLDGDGVDDYLEIFGVTVLRDGVEYYLEDFDVTVLRDNVPVTYFTDPHLKDSDSDDLDDYDEIFDTLTDPSNRDSDGDDLPDGWELQHGFNPLVTGETYQNMDGDRYPNIFEFVLGSDPNDSTSPAADPGAVVADYIVDLARGRDFRDDHIFTTISAAISEAQNDGLDYAVIEMKPGVYTGSGNCGVMIDSRMPKVLLISSAGAAQTIIDGQGVNYGLSFQNDSVVDGVSFVNCSGSAITVSEANVRFHTCVVRQSSNDVAIDVRSNSSAHFINCSVINNSIFYAGLYVTSSEVTLKNTILYNPSSTSEILHYNSTIHASDSIIRGTTGYLDEGGVIHDAPGIQAQGFLTSVLAVGVDLAANDGLISKWDMNLDDRSDSSIAGAAFDLGAHEFVDLDYNGPEYVGGPDLPLGDGLPDAWEALWGVDDPYGDEDLDGADGLNNLEEFINGTNPLLSDTDGDGFSDRYEVDSSSFDPLVSDADADADADDSDFDGVSDSDEMYRYYSNPEVADFDGTETVVVDVDMASYQVVSGSWIIENQLKEDGTETTGTAVSRGVRGALDYEVTVSDAGTYRLDIDAKQHNPFSLVDVFALRISVDGQLVEDLSLELSDASGSAWLVLPHLSSGVHTVTIEWLAGEDNSFLQLTAMRFIALGGPDTDIINGQADWLDNRLSNMVDIDESIVQSQVSPYTLEGDSYFVNTMQITSSYVPTPVEPIAPRQGLAGEFYAHIPLDPENTTDITIDEQSGAITKVKSIDWGEFNLLEEADRSLRLNDCLKLAAFTDTASAADFVTITVKVSGSSAEEILPGMTADDAYVYQFSTAGIFDVIGTLNEGGTITVETVVITVVDASLGSAPALIVGRSRNWSVDPLPAAVYLESDTHIQLSSANQNGPSRSYSLSASSTANGIILARLGEFGPIIDSVSVTALRNYAYTESSWKVIDTFANGDELVEATINLGGAVPDDLVIEMRTVYADILFLSTSTRYLTVTASDFDADGTFRYYMSRPPTQSWSCHRRSYEQDGVVIGSE